MDAGACKGNQDLGKTVLTTCAPAASAAASHSASAAAQQADDLADSTAQPVVSSAGDPSPPSGRLESTTPSLAATAAARESKPSASQADVVDLTADDEHSVQQSKSTGAATAPLRGHQRRMHVMLLVRHGICIRVSWRDLSSCLRVCAGAASAARPSSGAAQPTPDPVAQVTPADPATFMRQLEAGIAAAKECIRAETALAQFPAAGSPKQPFGKEHVSSCCIKQLCVG